MGRLRSLGTPHGLASDGGGFDGRWFGMNIGHRG